MQIEQAKIGDVIYTTLSRYSHGKVLAVKLETGDSVEYANNELLNRGTWQIALSSTPVGET